MISAASELSIKRLLKDARVRRAFAFFLERASEITAQQIEICQIPAPTFNEQKRAEYFRRKFINLGLTKTQIDAEGNVLALRPGADKSLSPLVVSAHLDTVFPAETDVRPRIEDGKIFAPGIMDDGCGLVALLAIAEVMQKLRIETQNPILFVATVGEEGAGNLRGVRHLFTKGEFAGKLAAFVSLDGAGVSQIVNRALGSKRYLIRITGSGGHSWLDAGQPNPVHALGRLIAKLTNFSPSTRDKATLNVGTVSGGTSVNSIPTDATAEIDLRSESEIELERLDAFFRCSAAEAVAEENAQGKIDCSPLESSLVLTGDRPSGETSENSALVRLAIEATKAVGAAPNLAISSTDANLAMSLKIPAITVGAGGTGDKMHTLGEWFDPANRELGLNRALLLILGFAKLSSDNDSYNQATKSGACA